MTPEELQQLKNQVAELMEWKRQRETIQITAPLDDVSKVNVGSAVDEGTGSTALTEDINLTGNVQVITVPAAYADTEIIKIGNKRMEIPVIAYL